MLRARQRVALGPHANKKMPARLLDGTAVANQIRSELAPAVASFTARAGRPPGLGIVLVGDDPASEIYVRGKVKSAGETGLRADLERLPATASLEQLLAVVDRLNRSDVHDGILVQSPLPEAMGADAERRVFDALDPAKVVDVGITAIRDRQTVERIYPAGSRRRETFERRGSLTVGDVHPEVAEVAGALSPVPGGVGPLTIVMLLKNTLIAATRRAGWAGQ